jgi:hypothetical protein
MRTMRLLALTACLCLVAGQAAFAGSPLKGIDVRLCKGAGDDCAARQTDADGVADFGAQPIGDYTVGVSSAQDAVVTITGAGKPIEQAIASDLGGRQRAARLGCHVWAVDTRLKVQVVAASRVKSHSNTNSN